MDAPMKKHFPPRAWAATVVLAALASTAGLAGAPATASALPSAAAAAALAAAQERGREAQRLAMLDGADARLAAERADSHDGDDAGGGHSIDEHRPVNADAQVFVRNNSGSVVVAAWNKNEVAVTGELGGDIEHLDISGDAASLSIVVRPPRHARLSGSADLRLMVPAAAKVSIETVSADIAVRGTHGAVKINTVSGDVGLAVESPEVTAQTVSGDLILQGPSASTAANSISGDLRMSGLQGKLVAETVSGHVELAGGRFSELRLKSISGDMHLDVSFAEHASVVGETLSGDISLMVPESLSGTAMLQSFSGEAQCSLATNTPPVSGPGRKHQREYTLGDGKGVNLSLSTFSGDIHVEGK
jgi:DUF4097 and DUF4098 domain-containing protein YvlB